MRKLCIIFIIAALVCPAALAATKTIVRQTKGHGSTRDEAIKKALARAVAQAKGLRISSQDYEFGFQSATADIDRKDGGKKVEFDAVSVQTGGSALKTEMEGLVKTHEVLSEKKLDDGTYEVTLKAWIYDYESDDQGDRETLAIMPLKALHQDGYRFGNLTMSAEELTRMVAQKLSVRFSETGKFAVLDREYTSDFAHNRNIALSGDSSFEEQAKLGKVLGADYMLVGTISDARLEIKEKTSSAIGRAVNRYEADFVFEYRFIAAPTRQVKLADTVNLSLETDGVKKLVKKWRPKDLDYREIADNLATMAADKVVETIIDRLYAVRIARIRKNGQIIINQGGKRIRKGQILEVFTESEELIDIDTNESLGKTETVVATIKIDRVTPKVSYAKLLKGDLSKISKGLICRRKKTPAKAIKGSTSDIERTEKGGVRLPFD